MERRNFLRTTGLTLGALALLNKNSLASFMQDPAYKIKMLTPSIGVFTEKGGTILFMLNDEGTIVVDSQFPDSAQHLIGEIKKKTEKPFRLLVNTHHHSDHSSGNIAFKGIVQHVLAHDNSKRNQQSVAEKQNKLDQVLLPDQTFSTLWSEKIGNENVTLHYFGAGHTNGDSLVEFKRARIVHVGDLVFNRRHPFVDRAAGAEIGSWIQVLEKTTKTFNKKTTYVCGHAGEGYDIILKNDDLLRFRDYLQNVLIFTAAEIKAGKTVDEIVKATAIPGSPEWKGDGIDRPLRAAYEELAAAK